MTQKTQPGALYQSSGVRCHGAGDWREVQMGVNICISKVDSC